MRRWCQIFRPLRSPSPIRGLAGWRGGPSWQKQYGPFPAPPSPSSHTPWDRGPTGTVGAQGGWVGELGGGPCPSLLPAASIPGMRMGRGSPGPGGIKAPWAPSSFGEDAEAGLQAASHCPQFTHPATCGHSLDAGGPGGLAWTDWRIQHSCPSRAAWAGSSRPALSLFHPDAPPQDPLGITVSLQAELS